MAANILIHIPHASLCLPPDFWRDVMVGRKIIEKGLRFMADYKVDELARDIDCHKATAKYSRLYCDVERFINDADEPMARLGLGYDDEWFSGNDALKLKLYIEQLGYSCVLNYPYAGALVPMDFYHDKTSGLRSVMLEINRRVYLEGETVRQESVRNIGKIIKIHR